MKTLVLPANQETIAQAAQLIKHGSVVAFPTETVYGLGANALDTKAVKKIFIAKNRLADNPLIIHIAGIDWLNTLTTHVSPEAQLLIEAFWPGPLSIVFSKSAIVPAVTTGGLPTVVVRFPSHPTAQALIIAADTPIAAPSANLSGRVSPTCAVDVFTDMNTRIPLILDDGAVDFGIESTVIDCTSPIPTLLRPGSITQEMIEAVIGLISTKPSTQAKSPGMKYRHYATNTPITLLTGTVHERQRKYEQYIKNHTHCHSTLISHHLTHAHPRSISLSSKPTLAASKLYSSLIAADKNHSAQILIEGFNETGVGVALMNRLRKAATDVQ